MSIRRQPSTAKQGVGGQSQARCNTDLEHGTEDDKRWCWSERSEAQEGGSEDLFMTVWCCTAKGGRQLTRTQYRVINGDATRTALQMRRMLRRPISRRPWASTRPDLRQAQPMKPSSWAALRQELLDPFRSWPLLVQIATQYTRQYRKGAIAQVPRYIPSKLSGLEL